MNNDSSLSKFKSRFTSVRSNRFRVDFPASWQNEFYQNTFIPTSAIPDLYCYCQSVSLPESSLDFIEIPYLGRLYYDSGDRKFNDLTLTFVNSQDFAIRNFIEEWMHNIAQHNAPWQTKKSFNIFMDELKVTQLDRRNYPIKSYLFYGVFPVRCDQIKLDFTDENGIETFDVDFRYQWWETPELKSQ